MRCDVSAEQDDEDRAHDFSHFIRSRKSLLLAYLPPTYVGPISTILKWSGSWVIHEATSWERLNPQPSS
jgi:hypothetical protein